MKGASNAIWAAVVLVVSLVGIFTFAGTYMLAVTPTPSGDYDGEFDDAYLATKAFFYADFTEGTDCNITSDVLGGSDYSSCIYDTSTAWNATASSAVNSRDWYFDIVVDIDGPVENMEVQAELQNTGTGQAADDVVIKEASLWTYEDEPRKIMDLTIEDQVEIDANTGVLSGDEYVLHIVMHSKAISPDFADGDDILRIDLELDTSGDVDSARITVEE